MSKARSYQSLLLVLALLVWSVNTGLAQTTEFTYQGKLVDAGSPANANYDFEFRLFSTDTAGVAIAAQTRLGVQVSNGIFTVQLDFGGQFEGNARWLEIAVKPAGSLNPLTVLTPRQPITSTPHSIRSLTAARADIATNSLQLGGVNASQYVLTTDSRMTDARNPLPNNSNYVQNTTSEQSASNFNISGNGTAGGTLSANAVNAATQYNIGGNRILSNAGSSNLFAGVGAGAGTVGGANSFFGRNAGFSNTTGNDNSFFGVGAGQANTTGSHNSLFGVAANRLGPGTASDNAIFGYTAGQFNEANSNSFFGSMSGKQNTLGFSNSFFGRDAGTDNTIGSGNSFFGQEAGNGNLSGNGNSFFGSAAGSTNTTGSNNTIIGLNADVGSGNLSNATAIGAGAVVSTSNTIVLGRSSDDVRVPGSLVVVQLGSAGSTDVCRNASNFLSTCSSSLRYKTSVQPFIGGLEIVRRLRPISFAWREGGMKDVGFAAEEVEQLVPLLATYNKDGRIEGVKYGQVTTVLVNAVNEQQSQIETQREQIAAQQEQLRRQQQQLNALKKLTCRRYRRAGACR